MSYSIYDLSDWKVPPQAIVLILLRSQLPLGGEREFVELEKDRLLYRFDDVTLLRID